MDNSYYHIAKNILKKEKSKNYDLLLDGAFQLDDTFESEAFLEVYDLLKERYKVIYKLFGEENFQAVCLQYFKVYPLTSAILKDYGQNFPNFLNDLEQLADYSFIKWLARVDWFWSCEKLSGNEITVPKGTLSSWANLYKDLPQIDVMLSENEGETIFIENSGNQYSISLR